MTSLPDEIARRRTFAIISHPDAGKTTLTEKLLLFGGAIQLAGEVKARGERRRARSDWMAIERERGISVSSAVMTFEHDGHVFNLLDTPGHQDFSEDTYRTLTAVDSAVMVIDAARGIEEQTRKLFEVCRLRDVPIITFINKLDREGRDPFDLIDEIEQTLALDVDPGELADRHGARFSRHLRSVRRVAAAVRARPERPRRDRGDRRAAPGARHRRPAAGRAAAGGRGRHAARAGRDGIRPVPQFDLSSFRQGHMTPVFFGSALNNFGVRELLRGVADLAPPPRPQPAVAPDGPHKIAPEDEAVSGFVFKVQANIDPQHRDRIALCGCARAASAAA